jgi:D-alanyl-D-alanine carboxypeptidase/D-alanyl-D-alanine-endopeptidase (penicillin-binding protein 4)
VGSLLDIAAEGNAEALSRTVELAALSQGDPVLTPELAEAFDQISRNAPDELLAALKAAPADSATAALTLVAQGNAASTEGDSPLSKAIARAEAGKDADLAAYAKTVEPDYAARLTEAKAKPKPAVVAADAPKAPAAAPAPPATPPPAALPNVSPKTPGG